MSTVTPPIGSTPLQQVDAGAEPGYTTTEFWITLATMVIGFLASAGVFDQAAAVRITGLATAAITIAFYAIGRAIRKSGTPG